MMWLINWIKQSKMFIIVGILLVFVVFSLSFTLTAKHWWKRIGEARVSYNQNFSPSAQVYRSSDGRLLIDLREYADHLYEVHYFEASKVWLVGPTNEKNFFFLPGYAYSRNMPPPTVDMGGPKIDIDPQITAEQNFVEFTSTKKARVRVTW
jgi:hypothetical protein